ncbi:DUF1589 domain-containing protein [Rhodopirellula islandica]|uniref:DUF1589 domain-containing protein n=1 Tax=Rhodopirellula islandica TaxID=595434 RepID=UPI0036F3096C
MLWNKASRPTTPARFNAARPITPQGRTWPTTSLAKGQPHRSQGNLPWYRTATKPHWPTANLNRNATH